MTRTSHRTLGLVLTALALGLAACDESAGTPDAPTLNPFPSPTNKNPLPLTGQAQAGATVQVRGGAQPVVTGVANEKGAFTVSVPLLADVKNTLVVSQVAENGKESRFVTVEVVHDGVAPTTPELSPATSPTRRAKEHLRGTTEPHASITVTGGAAEAIVTADAAGAFDVEVTLNTSLSGPVTNTLSVVATDLADNKSPAATVEIVFDASLPVQAPQVDAPQSPTNQTDVTLTGSAEAGVGISVVGSVIPASGTAGADGRFSIPVQLKTNATTTLYVFAIGSGQTSQPATIEIVHDSVPPEAPTLDPVASPTGAQEITLAGSAEPRARIDVTGGKAAANTTTGDDGRFSLAVQLTTDATNELVVKATDPAGNSATSTISVQQDTHLEVPVTLDPVTSPTTEATLTLRGKTEANANVQITGASAPVTVQAGDDGRFTAQVLLKQNTTNELHVARAGGTSDTVVVVVHDSIAPAMPSVNAIPSPTNLRSFDVTGTSEPGARVSVTGATQPASAYASSTGQFQVPVTIAADTTSTLVVVAADRAGNVSPARSVQVIHSSQTPAAPIVDTPNPAPTKLETYTVSGRLAQPAADTTIAITGGAAAANGPSDPSTGAFRIEVTLAKNQANELSVRSKAGAIESPPTIVSITHDDTKPALPTATAITVGKGSGTCLLRGTVSVTGAAGAVEARSRVRITNAATNAVASATANDDGAFSSSVSVCAGDKLRFVSIDAAGNESDPAEKTVP